MLVQIVECAESEMLLVVPEGSPAWRAASPNEASDSAEADNVARARTIEAAAQHASSPA